MVGDEEGEDVGDEFADSDSGFERASWRFSGRFSAREVVFLPLDVRVSFSGAAAMSQPSSLDSPSTMRPRLPVKRTRLL